jgi:lipopolysaccharide export system protein LptA
MEQQKVIVGEFENKLSVESEKGNIEATVISVNINKNDKNVFIFFSDETGKVQLVIPGTQIEKAKEILEIKLI